MYYFGYFVVETYRQLGYNGYKKQRDCRIMDNTLILVDYDNVYVTLKNNYRDFRNPNIMYDVITNIKEHYKTDNVLNYKFRFIKNK